MFEHTELFARAVGRPLTLSARDVHIQGQGRQDLTLRPEGTAPVARAFLNAGLPEALCREKLFYLGSMFRYENPRQAGTGVCTVWRGNTGFALCLLRCGSDPPWVRIAEELGLTGTTLYINTIGALNAERLTGGFPQARFGQGG